MSTSKEFDGRRSKHSDTSQTLRLNRVDHANCTWSDRASSGNLETAVSGSAHPSRQNPFETRSNVTNLHCRQDPADARVAQAALANGRPGRSVSPRFTFEFARHTEVSRGYGRIADFSNWRGRRARRAMSAQVSRAPGRAGRFSQ